MKKKVAFVVQRCGIEVNGGAEFHCLQLARHLANVFDVEVLTTCALDYMTWENHYPAGVDQVDNIQIRRFLVDQKRNVDSFNRLSSEIVSKKSSVTIAEQEQWMRAQGPYSTGLLDYIKAKQNNYDCFIFFGYLYASTYFGLKVAGRRTILFPFAHDEWTFHLPMWNEFFSKVPKFIFSTEEERSLVQRRFPNVPIIGTVIGLGIDMPKLSPSNSGANGKPYIMYLGRIDPSKGCEHLLDYFIRYKQENPSDDLQLVLAGKTVMQIPLHEDIIYAGFVDNEKKWQLLSGAKWLVMPSLYESLSISLLESWAVKRPALVNGKCEVLVGQVRRAQGGLYYENYEEWSTILNAVNPELGDKLGDNGHNYVSNKYVWDKVISACIEEIDKLEPPNSN